MAVLDSLTLAPRRPRILVVGYRKFSQLIHTVAPEFTSRADVHIVEHLYADAVNIDDLVEENNADILVSAGANAAYLAATLEVPVLSLDVSEGDLVNAIAKAREVSKRITLIVYAREYPLLDSLEELLNIELNVRYYQTINEAREQFLLASRASVDVIVGSSLMCDLAEREGIASILLYSRDGCRRLLESAVQQAGAQMSEREALALREALFEDRHLPTLVFDTQGEIVSRNVGADKLVAGEGVSPSMLARSLHADVAPDGATVMIAERRWQVSRRPVKVGVEMLGEVVRLVADSPRTARRPNADASARRLIFDSAEMRQIDSLIQVYASGPASVLIEGESGTGKELVARRLHQFSRFAQGELVAVNCGAIPESLFESELFGYTEGAFTSSRRGGRRGLIEQANHGVLFLDEISEMPLNQQAKLLRVLEERRVRPLGGNREESLDMKVIAATNCNLRERVRQGLFRDDLFYRLNVFSLRLPPLRERGDDIAAIAEYLLCDYAARYGANIDPNALLGLLAPRLREYSWPGNVRELENFVERLVISADQFGSGEELNATLPRIIPEFFADSGMMVRHRGGALQDQERRLIEDALTRFDNDKTRTAEYLGMSQTTLWRRLKTMQPKAG